MKQDDRGFSPLTTQTLRDQVVRRIAKAISTGHLKPGERLVEQDLATELNTSRAPIREAIRELVDRGLLVSTPRRGTFVASWSTASITEAYMLRGVLEEIAFRLVIHKASDAALEQLQLIVERMSQAALAGNMAEVALEDIAFHRCIVEMTGQHHLIRLWASLGVEAVIVFSSRKTDPALVPAEHQEMLDTIKRRDADAAIALNWHGIWQGLTKDTALTEESVREHFGPELAQQLLATARPDMPVGWLAQRSSARV
jgi:DNA-binding GntR family transcriptional regulator